MSEPNLDELADLAFGPMTPATPERGTKHAGDLRRGDRFLWCGRVVTVKDIHGPVKYDQRRPAALLLVDVPGAGERSLHYYDDERVRLA